MTIFTGYNMMYGVHGVSRIIQKHPSKATLNFFLNERQLSEAATERCSLISKVLKGKKRDDL